MAKSFTTSPVELDLLIYFHLDPGSQYNLSLSCSKFSGLLAGVSATHRANWSIFHRGSDEFEGGVAKLLCLMLEEPSTVWHMHTFDVCGPRDAFNPPTVPTPMNEKLDAFLSQKNVCGEEIALARESAIKVLREYARLAHTLITWDSAPVSKGIEEFNLELDQVLLLALSPRLRRINFVNLNVVNIAFDRFLPRRYYGVSPGDDFPYVVSQGKHPLTLFCNAIQTFRGLRAALWPPGLRHLRQIFIHDSQYRLAHLCAYAPLLLLPNIASLHIFGASVDGIGVPEIDECLDIKKVITPRSSSLQHLYFGGRFNGSVAHHMIDFARRARNLKTLVIQDHIRLPDIIGPLAESCGSTLERLILFNGSREFPTAKLTLTSSSPWTMHTLGRFSNLQILTMTTMDLVYGWDRRQVYYDSIVLPVMPFRSRVLNDMLASIPQSLRVLILHTGFNFAPPVHDLVIVDDALARVIESRQCQHLREIYVDGVIRANGGRAAFEGKQGFNGWEFPRSRMEAQRLGIKFHDSPAGRATDRFVQRLIDETF